MPPAWVVAAWNRRKSLKESFSRYEQRCSSLRVELSDAASAVKAAQDAFDAVKANYEEAEKTRASLDKELAELPLVFDPEIIAAFPVEMLREVFKELSQGPDPLWTELTAGQYNYERAAVSFRLAGVCQRWRDVAMSMPSLWRYIAVPPLRIGMDDNLGILHLSRVREVLRLSGNEPLDVLLTCRDVGCRVKNFTWFQLILLAIAQHASRWRRVRFSFPTDVDEWDLVMLRQSTPRLEEISVELCNGGLTPWKERYPAYLPECPSLQSVHATAVFVPPTQALTSLLSATIAVDEHCYTRLWQALQSMSHLQSLALLFRTQGLEVLYPAPTRPLHLPSLTSLKLSGYSTAISTWSPILHFPRLGTLMLHALTAEHIDALLPFFLAQGVATTSLWIESESSTQTLRVTKAIVPSLDVFQQLEHVTFRDCTFEDGFFSHALNTSGHTASRIAWPRLKSIRIDHPPTSVASAVCYELEDFVGDLTAFRNIPRRQGFRVSVTDAAHLPYGFRAAMGYALGPENCYFTDTAGVVHSADYSDGEILDGSEAAFTDSDGDADSSSDTDSDDESDEQDADDEVEDEEDEGDAEDAEEGAAEEMDGDGAELPEHHTSSAGASVEAEPAAATSSTTLPLQIFVNGSDWDTDSPQDLDYKASDSDGSDEEEEEDEAADDDDDEDDDDDDEEDEE